MDIVFDLGNVLLDFSPRKYLKNLGIEEKKREELYQIIFNSEEWIRLDRGTITKENAVSKMISKSPELEDMIVKIMDDWKYILTARSKTVKILKKLAERNYSLYVLSNFHQQAYQFVRKKYEFFELFDGIVISAKVKSIKPEAKIYKVLLNRYKLTPDETIFIDDKKQNIEKAKELGINTIHYQNEDKLKERLKQLLVSEKL